MSRDALVGIDQLVPLFDGRLVPYVNLDNAASTPAFRSVVETIDEFLPFYSGVHRGTGYKSRVSTIAFERARELVGEFVGADPDRDVVVFAKNTTEAINRLARSLAVDDDSVVLTTMLEHHSNDLPWRGRFRTVHVGVRPDGTLDVDDLDRRLAEHAGRVALLAVSGASNVTGVVQPVHQLAEKVHAAGGRILVDAAQLAPHRPIDMRPHDDPGHLDFVALSAHKMYAPYGTGALVGARCAFGPAPDHAGGGTVHAVTTDAIAWADLPDREEAGSPNVVGAVAMAAAIRTLTDDRARPHRRPRKRAHAVRDRSTGRGAGLTIHGPTETLGPTAKARRHPVHDRRDRPRVGRRGPRLRARRRGAQRMLLRASVHRPPPPLDRADARRGSSGRRHGDKRGAPGMVRISFGCYNDTGDVDRRRATGSSRSSPATSRADYRADLDGSFHPVGYVEPLLFSLDRRDPQRGAVPRSRRRDHSA